MLLSLIPSRLVLILSILEQSKCMFAFHLSLDWLIRFLWFFSNSSSSSSYYLSDLFTSHWKNCLPCEIIFLEEGPNYFKCEWIFYMGNVSIRQIVKIECIMISFFVDISEASSSKVTLKIFNVSCNYQKGNWKLVLWGWYLLIPVSWLLLKLP